MRRQAAAAVLRTRSRFRLSDRWFGTFLVAPAIIVFLVVIAYPIIRGIWVSFCANKLKNINNPTWNDFKNYQVIFKKGAFWNYFGNTLLFCFFTVGSQLVLGMLLALLLNSGIRGRKFFRGLFIIPWTIPSVVVAILWRWLIQQQYGVLNYILMRLRVISGMNLNWTNDPHMAMLAIIIACVWKQLPYMMVMLLAGLQSVDRGLQEAALIDGANQAQSFWHIMIPAIRPVLVTCVWLSITQNFQQFTIINNMTGGGPNYATQTLSVAAYKEAFTSYNFGTSAAIGVLWMVFLFVLTMLSNHFSDRFGRDIV
jgi:multiple sugar transport system permease protein